jgi:hypothetical protein
MRAPRLVERAVEPGGEVKEIDRLLLGFGGLGDQFVGRGIVQVKALLDQAMQFGALCVGDRAIDGGRVHQQGRGGQAVIVILEMAGMLAAFAQVGNQFPQRIEHDRIIPRANAPRTTHL